MLERNVQESAPGLGQGLVIEQQLGLDVRPPAARVGHPGSNEELPVDRNRTAVAGKDPGRHRREAVPRGEQSARLVERGRHQPAVHEPGCRLVALVEAEPRLVAFGALLGRLRKTDAVRVVATPPAGRVMVRRDSAQRRPPCWKCALKKFSDPAVAIAAEAEISSASVAAATIWAKR